MIEIALLADYPETIPTLTQWFRAQWPQYYAARTLADIANDFHLEANRDSIPVRLVAFANGELAGTITLRERAIKTRPEYHPGLGGLFVLDEFRGQGIGTELVKVGMKVAQEQGYNNVYTTTVTARNILERLGWQLLKEILHGEEHLALYRYELDGRDPNQGS